MISVLVVLAVHIYPLRLSSQTTNGYEQIIDLIYERLDNDLAERNIGYIDTLSTSPVFENLNCFEQGKIYHLLGVSHYTLDDEQNAIDVFQNLALTTWEDCEDVPESERANTIFNIGVSYQYTDEPHLAKPYIDKALNIFEKDLDYDRLYLAQNYLGAGNYYVDIHDIRKAESYFLNALNIYDQIPNAELDKFDIYNLLLILSLDFKNFTKAINYFNKAINYYNMASSTIPVSFLSQVYMNGAEALRGLKNYTDAANMARKGLAVINRKSDPVIYSVGLEILGTIDKETGSYEQAQQYFQEVLDIRQGKEEDLHSSRSKSIAYENIGELLLAQGKYDEALEYIDNALVSLGGTLVFDSDHNPIVAKSIFNNEIDVLRILSLKSKIHQEQFEKEKDSAYLKTALSLHYKIDSIIGQNITTYQSEYSKLHIYDLIVDYYGTGIEVAIELTEQLEDPSYIHDAYYFSSKSKGLILRNQISEMKALESVASPDMIAEERRLSKRINDIKESINNLSEAPDTLMRDYLQAQVELDVFIQNIENKNPEYYNRKHAFKDQLSVSDIQNKINADQVILEYFFSNEKLYSFWITKDDFFYLSIDNDQKLKDQLESYLSQIQTLTSASSGLSLSLYNQIMVEGLEMLTEEQTKICIIPDGLLHSLPFEALETSDGGNTKYLIEDYTISMSYASHLLFSEETANNGKKSYVGFGTNYNTELSTDLQKLSFIEDEINLSGFNLSENEVQQGAKLFSGSMFLNKDASTTNFQNSATEADIIHLSLHGLVNTDDPTKSCIVFDNTTDDFILTASDLYSYKINTDLVVLSSCHTANGKIYRGEGVQGMTKAFVLAGADHIVSSLWSASERTSSDILTTFLRQYNAGDSMSASLREAKLNYLSNATPSQRHPYYWANYVLIGDINNTAHPGHLSPYLIGLGVALLSLLTIFLFRSVAKRE